MGRDFVVESKGHCFLCLNKIALKNAEGYLSSSSTCSLQSLSRYLKLDITKVFHEKEAIPQALLTQVKKSKVKVELCEKCECMNKKFTELYRQWEKIEMEVNSSLKLIHGTLLTSENEGLKHLMDFNEREDKWSENMNILDVIRKEAIQKCSHMLGSSQPRVNVPNMRRENVMKEKIKLKAKTSSSKISNTEIMEDPVAVTELTIKIEQSLDTPISQEDIWDDSNPPSDGHWDNLESDDRTGLNIAMSNEAEGVVVNPQQGSREKARRGRPSAANASPIYEEIVPSGSGSADKMPIACVNPQTGKHVCPICSNEFGKNWDFRKHYKNLHLKIKYRCKLCEKIFSRISSCHEHYRGVHIGIRFKCRACSKLFTQKSALMLHQRMTSCRMKTEKL